MMRTILARRPSRWLVALAVAVMLGALGTASSVLGERPGCGDAAAAPIVESSKFMPYGNRMTTLRDVAFDGGADSAALPARTIYAVDSIDGLSRQHSVDSANGSVYSYYFDRETAGMMVSEFVRLGGLQLTQDAGTESFAAYLIKRFAERALPVQVGTFDGALTWADPDANGIRTHNLYWFDGENNYSLIGNRSATALLNLGRQLVCA